MIPGLKKSALILQFAIGVLILNGCAATDEVQSFRKNRASEQMFSFYDYRNGDETHWKVYFRDDKISELYRNGSKIPDREVKNYSNMIYDKIDDISSLRSGSDDNYKVFRFNGDDHKINMNKLKGDFKEHGKGIKFKVNKDLKDEMKKLSVEMEKLKDKEYRIKLRSKDFKDEMKNMKKELRKLKSDSSGAYIFRFDGSELGEELAALGDELKNIEIDIDLPEIELNLETLDDNLKELDIELTDLDEDLEKLDKFLEELKSEMVRDNLLNNENDGVKIRLEEDRMYVNDKEVPDHLFKKYKELYKKETGKEFKGLNLEIK